MSRPSIALFCCENSGLPAFRLIADQSLRDAVEVVRLPCSGKVEVPQLLQAFERGYEGVLVLGCPLDNCTYLKGSHRAAKRVEAARKSLASAGLDPDSLRMCHLSSVDSRTAAEAIRSLIESIDAAKAARERSGA